MSEHRTKRLLVSSGSPYEPVIGFSRAVRVGNIVAVGGTAAGSSGKTVAKGDPARADPRHSGDHRESASRRRREPEGRRADPHLSRGYCALGGGGRVHGEFFGDIRPASTMLQAAAFINPDWLVEIEADAVVEEG